jgi:hypothetical protein
MASKEEFAKVVGRAVLDSDFAGALIESPQVVAKSVGVRLDAEQVKAIRSLKPETIDKVSSGLRDVLGPVAFVDQQQQQQQARMD